MWPRFKEVAKQQAMAVSPTLFTALWSRPRRQRTFSEGHSSSSSSSSGSSGSSGFVGGYKGEGRKGCCEEEEYGDDRQHLDSYPLLPPSVSPPPPSGLSSSSLMNSLRSPLPPFIPGSGRHHRHFLPRWALIPLALLFLPIIIFILVIVVARGVPDMRYKSPPYHPVVYSVESLTKPFEVSSNPPWDKEGRTDVKRVQKELTRRFAAYSSSQVPIGVQRPVEEEEVVEKPSIQCEDWTEDGNRKFNENRYGYLRTESGPILVAVDLWNNEEVLPSLSKALLGLVGFLGPDKVYISVFENGSTDRTAIYMAELAAALTALGVRHSIVSDDHITDWSKVDRIEQLAVYRNVALSPIWGPRGEEFDTILFINDVYFCMTESLELLHQRVFQEADATCGLDWYGEPGRFRFYDNWVMRSLTGRSIRPRLDLRPQGNGLAELFAGSSETKYRSRFNQSLPIPVYSCWNGMIAMDARPFRNQSLDTTPPLRHSANIDSESNDNDDSYSSFKNFSSSFINLDGSRESEGRLLSEAFALKQKLTPPRKLLKGRLPPPAMGTTGRVEFRAADWEAGECEASESKLVAKDFWRRKFSRFVLVPTANVYYNKELWHEPLLRHNTERRLENTEEQEKIDWKTCATVPDKVICWPWTSHIHLDIIWLRAVWEDPF